MDLTNFYNLKILQIHDFSSFKTAIQFLIYSACNAAHD